MSVRILHGDALELLPTLSGLDSVVCDPPYGLEFMGKEWDSFGRAPTGGARFTSDGMGKGFKALPSFNGSPNPCCRNCGGSLRGNDRVGFKRCRCDAPDFPNTRLSQMRAYQHWCEEWARLAFAALKPGAHLLAFGGTRTFHRMACAIEDAGFEIRDTIMWVYGSGFPKSRNLEGAWSGWGTALKPAWEPIIVARRPLIGTVAQNVLKHRTGAINVDGCRVSYVSEADREKAHMNALGPVERYKTTKKIMEGGRDNGGFTDTHDARGRWPANLCHDGSDEVLALFPQVASGSPGDSVRNSKAFSGIGDSGLDKPIPLTGFGDSGSAARFFYCAKADSDDRAGSKHPTVKPLALMRWLVRLVTPPGGTVLDCFAGSGTTGEAARLEGFNAVLIEREADYVADIHRRLGRASGDDTPLFADVAAQ